MPKMKTIAKKEKTASEKSEIYRVATENMQMQVFVYDIVTKKIYFLDNNLSSYGFLEGVEYSIKDIIASGLIDADDTDSFKNLFKKIDKGDKRVEAVIKMRLGQEIIWANMILAENCNRKKDKSLIIGTIQDVTKRMESELRYSNERQYRMAMLASAHRIFEINVTRDRFIKLEAIQDTTDCENWNVYTETMAKLCKENVYREDWETFLRVATRENLLQGYKKGITEFHCEYRNIDKDGKTRWVASETHLLKDPVTGDIKGFIYAKDIDLQKRRELALYQQAERDPLTGVYNRRTAERIITQILISSGATQIHGFLTVDIDEFKKVNDTFGHLKGDYLLQQIANGIGGILRNVDVLARMGGDEFIVFLNNLDSVAQIQKIAERICNYVQNISIESDKKFQATISIGIAIYLQDGSTFMELYKKSDKALYDVKHHGKNGFKMYSSAMEKLKDDELE